MSTLSFNHPEELTRLWPDIARDTAKKGSGRRIGIGMNNGPGYGTFFVRSPRNRRVLVKAMPTVNRKPGSWYKHGLYLQREGASKDGAIGRGFTQEQDKVDLKTLLAQWQRETDPRFFKMILSPEQSDTLDLKAYTRRVMLEIERDLRTPLQWAAIDHHNTPHAHVHVVVRGMAEGQPLTMARTYMHGGIKERAQEVATAMLGPRSRHEMEQATQQAVQRRGWSFLDQSMQSKMNTERVVDGKRLTRDECQRLEHLEQRGLATRAGEHWRMTTGWEAKHMDERNRERTPRTEPAQDTNRPEEQKQERTEQEADEQHRRAVIVDELEHDLGWGR